MIKEDDGKWVVIGKNLCPWCDKVKNLIASYGMHYTYFSIDFNPEYALNAFLKASGLVTVPQVFCDGYLVGGYYDVAEYLALMHGAPVFDSSLDEMNV